VRKIFFMMILMSFHLFLTAQVGLPSCYHTYDEMIQELNSLIQQYPNLIKMDSIGVTLTDHIPLYAVKISNNVQEELDSKPALLFADFHAEEVIGNEINMFMIKTILEHQNSSPYALWLNSLELWFIPSLNPEGLSVVMSGDDVTFRKNKRDNNLNGIFDYQSGPGYDIDGVDPNRNFPFNWVHGDTLYSEHGEEQYDYYRGPYPLSEEETKALNRLAAQQHFVSGIMWHSSRTGNHSEKVYYPLDFFNLENRKCPEFNESSNIASGVANEILTESGEAHYQPLPIIMRSGGSTAWFYQKYGTIHLTVETSGIQPDSTALYNIIGKCFEGAKWLCNRFINGLQSNSPLLTGKVVDAETDAPLVAEVILEEKKAPYFAPRLTDSQYGRFWRVTDPGSYTLRVRKKGYEDFVGTATVSPGSWSYIPTIHLIPLQSSHYTGRILINDIPVDGTIIIHDVENDTIQTENMSFEFNSFAGTHQVEVFSNSGYPFIGNINFEAGNHIMNFNLDAANTIFSEDFENGTSNWNIDGPWQLISELSHSGNALTDSWGGYGFYAPNCDVNISLINQIDLSNSVNPLLTFWENLYTEGNFDFVYVEVSEDNENWSQVYQNSGKKDYWHPIFVDLNEFVGHSIYLRFRLTSDSPDVRLVDPGWTIDDIKVVSGNSSYTENNTQGNESQIPKYILSQSYPNPFYLNKTHKRAGITIKYQIKAKNVSSAQINIFNIKGQKIKSFNLKAVDIKNGEIIWDINDIASGVYLYQLKVNSIIRNTKKAIIIK
jgi:hypothetical protein